jgi:hypothetical protein
MNLPSLFDVAPEEEGGPIARTGFDYQDELAVSLLIEMLGDPDVDCIFCETHDDVVVCRTRLGRPVAEFVQVKAEQPYQYWSMAMLCERKGANPLSLLEKSLGHDQFQEKAWFRLVTAAPVNKVLDVLCKRPADRSTADKSRVDDLYNELQGRFPNLRSPKGNTLRYWLEHSFWDVRHDRQAIVAANLRALMDLADRERRLANWQQLNEFRRTMLGCVQAAGAARWANGVDAKTIRRSMLRNLWERIAPLLSLQFGPRKRVADFQKAYLAGGTGEVPFGGRENELMALSVWLTSTGSPQRALVVAPSGRGKSALMVHWLMRLQDSAGAQEWKVIFMPISMRYGTHLPSVFWQGIAVQLAEIFAEPLPAASIDGGSFYAEVCATFLARVEHSAHKILLVLDGIDEALEQSFSSHVFPDPVPTNLKILLTARQLANDHGPAGWLKRLDWPAQQGVQTFSIQLLRQEHIDELLVRFNLFPQQEERPGIVQVLQRLTEGEPLLIMLYVDDLRRKAQADVHYGIDDLNAIEPGFTAYVKNWIDSQRKAWTEGNSRFDPDVVDTTFAVLSCAYGPISGESLIHLVAQVSNKAPVLTVDTLIRPIQRFVIGDGTDADGYVFNHPKLAQYFSDSYFSAEARKRTHAAFVRWGRETVEQLNEGRLAAGEVPSYLLQHYLRHLAWTGASAEALSRVLSRPWQQAWDVFEGGYRGFVANAKLVVDSAKPVSSSDPRFQQQLAARLHASLCIATVHAFGTALPSELLALALDDRVMTLQQALHYIELQEPANQVAAYCLIFHHLSPPRMSALIEALALVPDSANRAQYALHALRGSEHPMREALEKLIADSLPKIDRPLSRLSLLVDWLPYRSIDDAAATIEALSAVALPDNEQRAVELMHGKVIRFLVQHGVQPDPDLLERFTHYFDSSNSLYEVATGLVNYADVVPELTKVRMLNKWRVRASQLFTQAVLKQKDPRGNIVEWGELGQVSKSHLTLELLCLQQEGQRAGLCEAIAPIVSQILDPYQAAETVIENLPLFPTESREVAIQQSAVLARSLTSANNRTHALLSLAKQIPTSQRFEMIQDALRETTVIEDTYSIASAALALYEHVSPTRKTTVYQQVIQTVMQVSDGARQGELMLQLASITDASNRTQLIAKGLQLIDTSGFPEFRDLRFINALTKLPTELQEAVFETCLQSTLSWSHGQDFYFSMHTRMLAHKVPNLWKEAHLTAVLKKANHTLPFLTEFLVALTPIARRYNRLEVLSAAQTAVSRPIDAWLRAESLAELYVAMDRPAALHSELIRCFESGVLLQDDAQRARTLVFLIPHLPPDTKVKAIDAAVQSVTALAPAERANNLRGLLDVVEDPQTKEELITLALTTIASLPPTQRLDSLRFLIPYFKNRSHRTEVLNLVTSGLDVTRSTLLGAASTAAPLMAELGGDDLIVATLQNMLTVVATWP